MSLHKRFEDVESKEELLKLLQEAEAVLDLSPNFPRIVHLNGNVQSSNAFRAKLEALGITKATFPLQFQYEEPRPLHWLYKYTVVSRRVSTKHGSLIHSCVCNAVGVCQQFEKFLAGSYSKIYVTKNGDSNIVALANVDKQPFHVAFEQAKLSAEQDFDLNKRGINQPLRIIASEETLQHNYVLVVGIDGLYLMHSHNKEPVRYEGSLDHWANQQFRSFTLDA